MLTLAEIIESLWIDHTDCRRPHCAAPGGDTLTDPSAGYHPLNTLCADPACDHVYRAPEDVRVHDVLRCPVCGTPSLVIDTGRGASVEYIRARALTRKNSPDR